MAKAKKATKKKGTAKAPDPCEGGEIAGKIG